MLLDLMDIIKKDLESMGAEVTDISYAGNTGIHDIKFISVKQEAVRTIQISGTLNLKDITTKGIKQ